MATNTPPTIYLKDYTPPAWWIDTVDLDFRIETGATEVRSTLALRRNPAVSGSAPLVLDGEELETRDVTVNGKPWPFSETAKQLTLDDLPDSFTLQTVVRIDPDKNTRLSGMYRSKDGYFTQCEAQGFRHITWFLDRPDVMSTYTVTLHADKATYPVLLANGNPVAVGDEAGAAQPVEKAHAQHRRQLFRRCRDDQRFQQVDIVFEDFKLRGEGRLHTLRRRLELAVLHIADEHA